MNYLWAFMILSGVIFSAFHGTIPAVTGAVLDSAKEAVTLCITMTGVMSFWMGLMRIAERGGVIAGLSRKLKPVLRFLFPQIPPGHVANEQIAANMIANIFGLGWAATPAGLKAMESLEELEESRRKEMGTENGAAKRKKRAPDKTSPGAPRYCQRRDVYVSDHEYLIPAVDPGQYYCLQKPVWEREPGGNHRTCNTGDCY